MAKEKPVTITLRVAPKTRDLLKLASDKDCRSMSNMVEVMIRKHCESHGIPLDAKRTTGRGSAR